MKTLPIYSFFFCCAALSAVEIPVTEVQSLQETSLDLSWVSQLVNKYEELHWLADENVRKTEEGISTTTNDNWSEPLFGKKYDEFERSVASLVCYLSILNGTDADYARLTEAQPNALRLTREAFFSLHAELQNLLNDYPALTSSEVHQAIKMALILGDMGKTQTARERAKVFRVEDPDHDDFITHALQVCPQIFPSYQSLPVASQNLIAQASGLAHFGHVAHLEGGPEILSKLKNSQVFNKNPFAFKFAFFVHMCDVAGALGHRNCRSSLVFTQDVYNAYSAIKSACHLLQDHDEKAAYRFYLDKRAEWLGLNSNDSLQRVLTRIGAMLRLYTPQEGKILLSVATSPTLSDSARELIMSQFDRLEPDALTATPTYIPAVLVNLINNPALEETHDGRIKKAIEVGLVFIARVLNFHRAQVAEGRVDGKIPLNFNGIAGIAKEKNAASLLETTQFVIDSEGTVQLSRT